MSKIPAPEMLTLQTGQSSWRQSTAQDRSFGMNSDLASLDDECEDQAIRSLIIVRERLGIGDDRGTKKQLAQLMVGPFDHSTGFNIDELPEGAQTLAIALCQAASEVFDCRISIHLQKTDTVFCPCLIGPCFTRPLPVSLLTTPCVWTDQIGQWPRLESDVCGNFGAVFPSISGTKGPTDPIMQVLQRVLKPDTAHNADNGTYRNREFIEKYY